METSHLIQAIEQVENYHSHLVIVTGDSASLLLDEAASNDGLALVNLGLSFSEKLLEVPIQLRSRSVECIFADLLHQLNTNVVLLNQIEVLFDKTLSIEPLKLLQNYSKNLTLVVAWPGEKTASSLIYAVPSHPEYRCYKTADLGETIYVDADKNG